MERDDALALGIRALDYIDTTNAETIQQMFFIGRIVCYLIVKKIASDRELTDTTLKLFIIESFLSNSKVLLFIFIPNIHTVCHQF
jgi:hypothetical protein